MTEPRPSLCMTCGLEASPTVRMNRLADGRACPACLERLLDDLPPLLPGFGHLVEARETAAVRGANAAAAGRALRGPRPIDVDKKARRGRRGAK